jgi:hypothetical protein
MKTNTDTPKTLADFAPEMLAALRAITHPMAADDDLQDALALLAEIDAARKAASDAAFIAAAMPDAPDFNAAMRGMKVKHGSPHHETPEIIFSAFDCGEHVEIVFESGCFTYIGHRELATFLRTGRIDFARLGSGSLAKAHESMIAC